MTSTPSLSSSLATRRITPAGGGIDVRAGDEIGEQPMIGRIVPELQRPKLRERFLYSYRVIV